jgi:hypothetical protein
LDICFWRRKDDVVGMEWKQDELRDGDFLTKSVLMVHVHDISTTGFFS